MFFSKIMDTLGKNLGEVEDAQEVTDVALDALGDSGILDLHRYDSTVVQLT